jgi:hypothetical protein
VFSGLRRRRKQARPRFTKAIVGLIARGLAKRHRFWLFAKSSFCQNRARLRTSVFGLHIKNPHIAGGFSDELPRMPISVDSLRRSVTQKLQRQTPDCDWQSGYKMWRDANAGAFTEPVSECVKFTEDTLNHGKPQA